MKKSTIMITAAVLVILGSLTAFNIKIKQIYLTGSYKSRFNGMDFTPLNGLENIDIQNANKLGIKIEQGEKEGIWIGKTSKDIHQLDFHDHTLKMGFSEEAKKNGYYSWDEVVIITKNLKKVKTMPYISNPEDANNITGTLEIKGYQIKNLDLQVGLGGTFFLYKMQMDTLNAIVGDEKNGKAALYISSDTKINTANLNVPGKSTLTLADPKITKAVYNLSDSATVSLNGKMVQLIK